MPWREFLAQEILIRLADDDTGFVYSVRCAGVPLWHRFVPTLSEEEGPRERLFAQPEGQEADDPDGREDDLR